MINPYHLKYFCDACRNQSLVKSADVNRISHSAISQAIKSLENTLNTKLLFHGKRQFILTPEGHRLFEQSDDLFLSFEKVIHSVKSSLAVAGPLPIGVSHSVAQGVINQTLTSFCLKKTEVDPKVFIGNSKSLEDLLLSRKIEIGFGIEDGSFVSFERTLIYSGRFVLVGNQRGLKRNCFLVGDKGTEVSVLRSIIKKSVSAPRFIEIQSWSLLLSLAQQGLGVAMVPDFLVKKKKMLLKSVYNEIKLPPYNLYAFYRSQEGLSVVAKSFLSEFKNNFYAKIEKIGEPKK